MEGSTPRKLAVALVICPGCFGVFGGLESLVDFVSDTTFAHRNIQIQLYQGRILCETLSL